MVDTGIDLTVISIPAKSNGTYNDPRIVEGVMEGVLSRDGSTNAAVGRAGDALPAECSIDDRAAFAK
jgi:hypothetical protein